MPRLTTATAVVVLLSALCRGFDDAASPDVAERPPSSSCGLSSVGAGGSLMVALKLLYDGVVWQLIAAALVASLCFHTGDLVYRWRNS